MRHLSLNSDRWFVRTSTGTLRKKRVSAQKELQFPRWAREIFQQQGTPALVKEIRKRYPLMSVSTVWEAVETMFNGDATTI